VGQVRSHAVRQVPVETAQAVQQLNWTVVKLLASPAEVNEAQ
jgi:hypothetical protein